jgi:hypothetical protein
VNSTNPLTTECSEPKKAPLLSGPELQSNFDEFVEVLVGPDSERRRVSLDHIRKNKTPPVVRALATELAATLRFSTPSIRNRVNEVLAILGQPAADVLARKLSNSKETSFQIHLAEAITAMAPTLDGTNRLDLFCTLWMAMTVAPEITVKAALMKTIMALRNSGGSTDAVKGLELKLTARGRQNGGKKKKVKPD